MAGLALLARELGHEVTGSDTSVYPPMSTQLQEQGISLVEGYDPAQLEPPPDLVIIGNALSRGNPCVEYILNYGLRFQSGPQWLNENVLSGKHVLAVSGTHGKTTTTAMLAWTLEVEGMKPGFLVGGIPENFGISARIGGGEFFVIEADEYDTAFFDKRSKFIHYRPKTLIINNIEFDHADIFADIAAIRREFHHLVRIVPNHGLLIALAGDAEIQKVLEMGCWTPVEYFGGADSRWQAKPLRDDYSEFEIIVDNQPGGILRWDMIGKFNAHNVLATAAAASHVGITAGEVCEAMADFKSVKRRMQLLAKIDDISIYDDFAHHPTEIRETLSALRHRTGDGKIIAVMEPRSNTMKMGKHQATLASAFDHADQVLFYQASEIKWDLSGQTASMGERRTVFSDLDNIIGDLMKKLHPGDTIIFMSNGGFGGIQQKLIKRLQQT